MFKQLEYSVAMSTNPNVSEIVDALGGNAAVAEICGVGATAVSNWRSWNCFPPRLYLALSRAGRAVVPAAEVPEKLFKERAAA